MLRRCLPLIILTACGSAVGDGELIVEFSGLENERGRLAAALVDSADGFLARDHIPLRQFSGPIRAGTAIWVIDNLEFGSYAISAYHDENVNGELDAGLFGIPAENYGFSNNARGSFGPPDFEDARFEFNSPGQKLMIKIQ